MAASEQTYSSKGSNGISAAKQANEPELIDADRSGRPGWRIAAESARLLCADSVAKVG